MINKGARRLIGPRRIREVLIHNKRMFTGNTGSQLLERQFMCLQTNALTSFICRSIVHSLAAANDITVSCGWRNMVTPSVIAGRRQYLA